MSVDLSTTYLGLKLKHPLVISACPLTADVDGIRRMEQAGAAAAVLPSLFEEQIEFEESELDEARVHGAEAYAEHSPWFPEPADYHTGTEQYLETIEKAKKTVAMPIIASLNGTSRGGSIRYAKMMQDAGADALELNIYFVAAELGMTGQDVENRYVDLVSAVKQSISIPLAVKVGPYFSAMGNFGVRLAEAGADGLVLFNRFYQPDINIETMQAEPRLHLSSPYELLVPVRWIAVLHGHVQASLAATGGIHDAAGLLKALLAGADVGMITSVLYQKGTQQIGHIVAGLQKWMEENEYGSVEQLKGSMSLENCPDPTAFQRGNYMKALTSYVGKEI